MGVARESISQLLISRLVGWLGLEAAAERFGYPNGAPYLYCILLLLFFDLGMISVLKYIRHGFHPVFEYPFWFLPPLGAGFGVWVSHHLSNKYDSLVASLSNKVDDQRPLRKPLMPFRLQVVTYLVFLMGVAIWLAQPGVLSDFLSISDPVLFSIDLIIVNAGGYYLIIAEVIAVLIGIHILLPRRIIQSKVDLDFADPSRSGGLRPVGKLIQRSTRFYFIGLFAYTMWVFATRLFPSQTAPPNPGQFLSLVFFVAWFFGFILFLLPTIWLHYEMRKQKQARLDSIYRQLAEIGRDTEPFPDTPPDEELSQYLYLHRILDHTERTHDYPTDAALIRDIGISAMPSLLTYIGTIMLTSM